MDCSSMLDWGNRFDVASYCSDMFLRSARLGQDDGRDYLTALIEDNLSSAGRSVTITGFQGALSSKAQLDRLTIADDAGIWISLQDVQLDWTRSDLLRGRLTINSLTADEIHLSRLPNPDPNVQVQAGSFTVPELPVSVNIGSISAENLILDAPILGQALRARITADMLLVGGEGSGNLQIERTDAGPKRYRKTCGSIPKRG